MRLKTHKMPEWTRNSSSLNVFIFIFTNIVQLTVVFIFSFSCLFLFFFFLTFLDLFCGCSTVIFQKEREPRGKIKDGLLRKTFRKLPGRNVCRELTKSKLATHKAQIKFRLFVFNPFYLYACSFLFLIRRLLQDIKIFFNFSSLNNSISSLYWFLPFFFFFFVH